MIQVDWKSPSNSRHIKPGVHLLIWDSTIQVHYVEEKTTDIPTPPGMSDPPEALSFLTDHPEAAFSQIEDALDLDWDGTTDLDLDEVLDRTQGLEIKPDTGLTFEEQKEAADRKFEGMSLFALVEWHVDNKQDLYDSHATALAYLEAWIDRSIKMMRLSQGLLSQAKEKIAGA